MKDRQLLFGEVRALDYRVVDLFELPDPTKTLDSYERRPEKIAVRRDPCRLNHCRKAVRLLDPTAGPRCSKTTSVVLIVGAGSPTRSSSSSSARYRGEKETTSRDRRLG